MRLEFGRCLQWLKNHLLEIMLITTVLIVLTVGITFIAQNWSGGGPTRTIEGVIYHLQYTPAHTETYSQYNAATKTSNPITRYIPDKYTVHVAYYENSSSEGIKVVEIPKTEFQSLKVGQKYTVNIR